MRKFIHRLQRTDGEQGPEHPTAGAGPSYVAYDQPSADNGQDRPVGDDSRYRLENDKLKTSVHRLLQDNIKLKDALARREKTQQDRQNASAQTDDGAPSHTEMTKLVKMLISENEQLLSVVQSQRREATKQKAAYTNETTVLSERLDAAENNVQQLTDELKEARIKADELETRSKLLLQDFRQVVTIDEHRAAVGALKQALDALRQAHQRHTDAASGQLRSAQAEARRLAVETAKLTAALDNKAGRLAEAEKRLRAANRLNQQLHEAHAREASRLRETQATLRDMVILVEKLRGDAVDDGDVSRTPQNGNAENRN